MCKVTGNGKSCHRALADYRCRSEAFQGRIPWHLATRGLSTPYCG